MCQYLKIAPNIMGSIAFKPFVRFWFDEVSFVVSKISHNFYVWSFAKFLTVPSQMVCQKSENALFRWITLSVILLEWLYQLTNLKSDEIVMIRSQVIFS